MHALNVVAQPQRARILRLVWDRDRSAGEIAANFDVTLGAVSQHLKVLRDAGFVTVRKDGNRRIYRADPEGLGPLRAVLEAMWATSLDGLVDVVERDGSAGAADG